jgi:hypothetical protein
VFSGIVGRRRAERRKAPNEAFIDPSSGIGIPGLGADAVCSGCEEVSVGKEREPILIAHTLHFSTVGIMPQRLHMRVITPGVVKDVNDTVVEAKE